MRLPFEIKEHLVPGGERRLIDLPVAKLSNHTSVTLPVHILHGRKEGPTLFVCAAIHGDEILGVEIIRRVLRTKALRNLCGTLLCIPIVNAFGFISHSRYMQDRRDLNRCFPGSATGPLAAQLAHIFMQEVVKRSDLGIDLHTGAINKTNLPQLRGDFTKPKLRELADVFGAPIILQANLRDGSLRQSAEAQGTDILLYEAGEALRFDELSIRIGTRGILRVMQRLEMLKSSRIKENDVKPFFSRSSKWIRAHESGLFRAYKTTGDSVENGELLGIITNPYEENDIDVKATLKGLIIGRTNLPVINQGDALFHIARVKEPDALEENIEQLTDEIGDDPIFDEDEII